MSSLSLDLSVLKVMIEFGTFMICEKDQSTYNITFIFLKKNQNNMYLHLLKVVTDHSVKKKIFI